MISTSPRFLPPILSIALALLASCTGDSPSKQAAEVRATFEGYKQAILDEDGEQALGLVSEDTILYYGRMLGLALDGERTEVQGLSTADKLMVVTIRHRVPIDTLRSMSAEDIFVHAVEQGWIGRASVINNELGQVVVKGSHATGVHISQGEPSSYHWIFRKEDEKWRLDLLKTLAMVDVVLKEGMKELGASPRRSSCWAS